MPLLKFEVQADYDKVIKLREEINKLEQSLTSLSPEAPASAISKIETRLAAAKSEFSALTSSAAIAGAEIEDSFKSKISSTGKPKRG